MRSSVGRCHLCECEGPLTFEHIPPRRVFNDRPALAHTLYGIQIGSRFKKPSPPSKYPRGVGRYALCKKCNEFTADYYGGPFADWTYQCLAYAEKIRGDNYCHLSFRIRPLSVLKQILTMGLAISPFSRSDPLSAVRKFVRCPHEVHCPNMIRVKAYLNPRQASRQHPLLTQIRLAGHCSVLNTDVGRSFGLLAEVAFPPLGYLIAFTNGGPFPPSVAELADITHFGSFAFDAVQSRHILLPVKIPFGPVPGYYPQMNSDSPTKFIADSTVLCLPKEV
jgi:hypothetical protein